MVNIKNTTRRRLRTKNCARGTLAAAICFSSIWSGFSAAHDNEGAVQTNGRFTPNEAGAEFPPQPREITNIRKIESPQNDAAFSRLEDPAVTVLSNAVVAAELGQRYAHISTANRKDKWDTATSWNEILYFSYTSNQSVRVIYRSGQVESIETSAASDDQPALGESEKAEAIALARSYWINKGNTQIQSLKGYAIQTFQDDGSPFPTRMTYVSFHVESPEPPVLANRVDLTGQLVVSSELAQ